MTSEVSQGALSSFAGAVYNPDYASKLGEQPPSSPDFEEKLEQYNGNVERSVVELAKDWRTDKYLRRLEAMLAVVSSDQAFVVSGTGDIIEPDDKIVAIGSGGMFAVAAAKMLKKYSDLSAQEMCEVLMKEVKGFQASRPQFDDMTMLILKVR